MRRLLQLGVRQQQAASRRPLRLLLPVVLVMAGMITACGSSGSDGALSGTTPEGGEIAAAQPPTAIAIAKTPTPLPTPSPTPSWSVDSQVVNTLLNPEDGVFGIVLMAENGDILYSRNATTPFITASVYKIIVLADILKRVEAGEFALDDQMVLEADAFPQLGEASDTYFEPDDLGTTSTIREMLYATGAYSSNAAARTLLKLTTPESLTATAREIGMDRTSILTELEEVDFWPPTPSFDAPPGNSEQAVTFVEASGQADGPVNITTPSDLATFMRGLLTGETVSPYVSNQILSILLQNRIDDRIPFLLDDRYVVANKPGNLEHVTNDAGIIYTQSGPRIIVTLSEDTIWDGRAREAIQRIALIATGTTSFDPIPDEAMQEGYFPDIEWGTPDDPNDIIQDP